MYKAGTIDTTFNRISFIHLILWLIAFRVKMREVGKNTS